MTNSNQTIKPSVPSDLKPARYRPGDKNALDSMLRVDHAGEFGATCIYQGQIAGAKAKPLADVAEQQQYLESLEHMLAQEQEHLRWFEDKMRNSHTRPSIFMPLWEKLGFELGRQTAMMGKPAAMACTIAIESEIELHYQQQIDELAGAQDKQTTDLRDKIIKFRQEELEHHDHAIDQGGNHAPHNMILQRTIKAGARLAINLAKHF